MEVDRSSNSARVQGSAESISSAMHCVKPWRCRHQGRQSERAVLVGLAALTAPVEVEVERAQSMSMQRTVAGYDTVTRIQGHDCILHGSAF